MHKVWLLLLPGFILLDVINVRAVLQAAAMALRRRNVKLTGYDVRLASTAGGPVLSSSGVPLSTGALPRQLVGRPSTLLVCGEPDQAAGQAAGVSRLHTWLSDNRMRLRRFALLGNKKWLPQLPAIRVARRPWCAAPQAPSHRGGKPNRFNCRTIAREWRVNDPGEGSNLALSWVREDLGVEFARALALRLPGTRGRRDGMPYRRGVPVGLPVPDARIGTLHQWISMHLHEKLSVDRMAREVYMSTRSFVRFYERETGLSPGRGVQQIRLDAARRLIETSARPLKAIAAQCGYGSEEVMRRAFVRDLQVTPSDYRRRHATMKDARLR
jgi:transcriptional regulator GlxA family with amidase domain